MLHIFRLLFVLVIIFTFSCGSTITEKGAWTGSKIEFTRGSCYGMCPAYMVTVFGTGKVYYIGYSHTKKGLDSTVISLKEVDVLFTTLVSNGFFELQNEYINSSIPDLPSVSVKIFHNGKEKSVVHTAGITTAPQWLSDFDYKLDSTVNIGQWRIY